MTLPNSLKDLLILTADNNCRFALSGILTRTRSLRIRKITADFHVHPGKDPGTLRGAHEFLRPFARSHRHALVVMDREGSGKEEASREELEAEIERALSRAGWDNRGKAIVIDPELEIWVWNDSTHVDEILGWSAESPGLRPWLQQQEFWTGPSSKPNRPKEALEAALRHVRLPRSSAIYKNLAEKVGLSRCTDPSFEKLRKTLQDWFPAS